MTSEAREIREFLRLSSITYLEAKRAVENLERDCNHKWNCAVYDPIKMKGGIIEASGAGSDYRPSFEVAPKETPRWTRECMKCGKVEHTEQTDEHITRTPKFAGDKV